MDESDQHAMSTIVSPAGEYAQLRDFYIEHKPVYAPGFGPNDPPQVSLTRQEFAEECDINHIMKKYDGAWPPPPVGVDPASLYLDVSDVPDLMTAHAYLEKATAAFMTLPATVRREFNDDPRAFVEFAQEPRNLDKMREWKLAPPAKAALPHDATAGLTGQDGREPAPVGSNGATGVGVE